MITPSGGSGESEAKASMSAQAPDPFHSRSGYHTWALRIFGPERQSNMTRYFLLYLVRRYHDTPNVHLAHFANSLAFFNDAIDGAPTAPTHVVLGQAPLSQLFLKR